MNRAEELAEAHWKYIEAVLNNHGVDPNLIDRVGYHYITAMIHGYGHGVEDAKL